jgi:hypothetical protein
VRLGDGGGPDGWGDELKLGKGKVTVQI